MDFTILKEQFENKKVFVTGHTGFKGSWLLLILKELGAKVVGYALAPENEADLFNQIDGAQYCEKSIIANILDAEQLKKEMEQLEKQFQNKKDDFELNDLQEFQEMVKELKKKIHEEMKNRGYFN